MVAAVKLHRAEGRRRHDRFIVEGRHLLGELLDAQLLPEVVFAVESGDEINGRFRRAGVEIVSVSEPVLAKLSTTMNPAGPVAVVPLPPAVLRTARSCVVAWGVSDPGNLGTIMRSGAAFGVATVIGPGCADPWSPKVLRAGAGAHFRGQFVNHDNLTIQDLRDWGLFVVAAVPRGGGEFTATGSTAVVIGAEGAGLAEDVQVACDATATLAMPGDMESLNAGVTGSLFAYLLAANKAALPLVGDD